MSLQTYNLTALQTRALGQCLGENAPGPRLAVHTLEGQLDVGRLERAVEALQQYTSIFHRNFTRVGSRWSMVVGDGAPPRLQVVDFRGRPDTAAAGFIRDLAQMGFRPEGHPLARFTLVLSEGPALLVFTAAPWLVDQCSISGIHRALSKLYAEHRPVMGHLDLDQEAMLAQEAAFTDSATAREARRFWLSLLRDRQTEIVLARSSNPTGSNTWSVQPSELEQIQVHDAAADLGIDVSLLRTFLVHLVLARMAGTESMVTNTISRPLGPADHADADRIGFAECPHLIVTTPLRQMRLRDYLLDSNRLHQQCKAYHRFSAVSAIKEYEPAFKRFTNITTVSDFLLYGALNLPDVVVTLVPELSHPLPASDVAIDVSMKEDQYSTFAVRNPAHMPALQQLGESFRWCQETLLDNLDLRIGDLGWLSEEARKKVFSLAVAPAPETHPRLFLDRFLDQVERTPDGEAVRCGDDSLTYLELLAAADALAARLRGLIGSESLVGICLNRGIGMIVALIGVMRAGAGYVPLDPSNPRERLTYILNDANVCAVVCEPATEDRLDGIQKTPRVLVPTAEEWLQHLGAASDQSSLHPSSPAYVIYTSGTTGLPKGVVVEQRQLAAFLAATDTVCACGPGQRWTQLASINFDASVLEIGGSLARGAAIVIATSENRTDPEAVWALLDQERITHAFIPPALLRLLPRQVPSHLTDIYMGGEAGDDLTAAFWSRGVRLWNVYGPTETTVLCSAQLLGESRTITNLGGPLPGYAMFVLDESMQLVPQGAIGELWIGGEGVTRGYRGRDALTAEKFIPNPFGEGRLYRSGDLARYLPNGDLEYLGRNDFQVKIRGFRIELGDIEAAISGIAGVTGTYVSVINGPGDKALAAWYTGGPLEAEVEALIERRLPHYMVPPHLMKLEHFPLNISGKIDRNKLPLPEDAQSAGSVALTPRESLVRDIWADVLGLEPTAIIPESNFFHLGGHSLLAATACHLVSEVIQVTVWPRWLFEHPTLVEFCESIRTDGDDEQLFLAPLQPTGIKQSVIPGAMPAMFHSRQLHHGADTAYTITMRVDMDAEINPLTLRKAVVALFASDPIFSTAMVESAGRLTLVKLEDVEITVPLHVDVDVETRAQELRHIAFDLSQPPLWRAEILSSDSGTTLLLAIHHGIFDGWSLNLFLQDLAGRYDALISQAPYQRIAASMLDYGQWLESHPDVRERDRLYWQQKLSGASLRTLLPTATGISRLEANHEIAVAWSQTVTDQLKQAANELGVTLAPVLLAAFLVWVWRISGQRQLVVPYPFAGRDAPGTEQVYGMLVQMGFLRVDLEPDESFSSLVNHVAQQMVADREHFMASPYDTDLSTCGSPNILFSLQSGIGLKAKYGSINFSAHEYSSSTSKADLVAILYDDGAGGLDGRFEIDSSALDLATMQGLIPCFDLIVQSLSTSARISDLAYMPSEMGATIERFSMGVAALEGPNNLVSALREAAARHADAIAIVSANRSLTFAEFDAETDQLARIIRERFSPQRDQRIGLSVQKSAELIIGMVAILKSGCAYVPLDSTYPEERLRLIIEDAGLQSVVADQACTDVLQDLAPKGLSFLDPQGVHCDSSELDLPEPDPRDLAYLIYTSGSTGRPKGVMIEHGTVPRLMRASAQMFDFDQTGRMLLLGTVNFDVSVWQVFLPLLTGGTLIIPPADIEKDLEALHTFIDAKAITHILVTPALLRNLPRKSLPVLKFLAFAGEAIDAATAAYWSEQTTFWSLYGPTETTVICSAGRVNHGGNFRIIGKPIPGYSLTVRNELLEPVPLGAIGEIFIGGGGASRGYLGLPELTLERFIPDPDGLNPFDVVYRSGDLGRFLPDGTIECLGRNDDQVKLRGFRIELGEIETVLLTCEGVTQSVVVVRGDGDLRRLVAYITGDGDLDIEVLLRQCAQRLPDYMVPSTIVHLEAMPLNPNGKLDRKALPEVSFHSQSEPPRQGLESQIAQVWEELLHVRGIGRHDDFFRLGGNSLVAARLRILLAERVDLVISTAGLYASPTIAALASQGQENPIDLAVGAATCGLALTTPVAPKVGRHEKPTVLLTGAAGFLGTYLLADLQRQGAQVVCLLRATDPGAAETMLRQRCEAAGLAIDFEAIEIVLGDLAMPTLGLDPSTWARLADGIDVIVHCGAWVHHRYSYSTLRAVNVGSTEDLLRLALAGARRSRFCFVSTESAAEGLHGLERVIEDISDPVLHPPLNDVGYTLSKWVGEHLVQQAYQRHGLDGVIARPGNITGDSHTGYSNYASNHFWLFVKSCLQLQAVPNLSTPLEMTPVDALSTAIVALALDQSTNLTVTNLGNPASSNWAEIVGVIAEELDRPMDAIEPNLWQRQLVDVQESNALFALRDLYLGELDHDQQPVDRLQTTEQLARLGHTIAVDPLELARFYARYLQDEGFWTR